MKGKFITLVLTLGFLAAFGVFMHSPPSILDGLTGATPKAKRAAQMAAPLEGNYLFCINPALEPFSDADFRNDLKAFILLSKEHKKSEPFSYWKKVRILLLWCTSRDSNPGPTD